MIQFLICSSVSYKTGRRLAKCIGELQGSRCFYYNKNTPPHPDRRHVRWGSRRPTSDNCLNRLPAVRLSSNKLAALVAIRGQGVRTPNILANAFESQCAVRRIFRKRERHAGNDDPYIVAENEPADLARAADYDYALEFIDTANEYRVHVFRGEPLRVQEKRPRGDAEPDPHIRSSRRGWVLHDIENPFPGGELTTPAIQAVQSLGLDFGAVDVLRAPDGEFYVIEVNTAPGLNSLGANLYAEAIIQWDHDQQG